MLSLLIFELRDYLKRIEIEKWNKSDNKAIYPDNNEDWKKNCFWLQIYGLVIIVHRNVGHKIKDFHRFLTWRIFSSNLKEMIEMYCIISPEF